MHLYVCMFFINPSDNTWVHSNVLRKDNANYFSN